MDTVGYRKTHSPTIGAPGPGVPLDSGLRRGQRNRFATDRRAHRLGSQSRPWQLLEA
jgi:hypothetical protein